MKIFESSKIGPMTLKNRYVMPPMCMYSVKDHDGMPNHFHMAHYVSRAIGQVGLIIVEATGVLPEGRITDACLGLWNDAQRDALKEIVDAVHQQGSKIGIQLNHAGRKCGATLGVDTIYGPSEIAYNEDYRTPNSLTTDQIKAVIQAFVDASKRADEAGFDVLEIHMAHGYLLSSFMSPLSNKRTDAYKDPSILFKELMNAIQTVWPKEKPIIIRISATDYEPEGYDVHKAIEMIRPILNSIDAIHVSSGGITPTVPKAFPGYQVQMATTIREQTQKPVIAVGLITTHEQAMDIVGNQRADYVAIGRALLRNPHWVLEAMMKSKENSLIPKSYLRGFR